MAIQNRRGAYTDFDPTKMVAGEFAVVQSDDPNVDDGKAVYMAFTAGNVKRLATYEDMAQSITDATEEVATNLVNQIEADVATSVSRAETAATNASNSASAAAESARTLTIDDTLTQTGQAAGAKATGDAITQLNTHLNRSDAYFSIEKDFVYSSTYAVTYLISATSGLWSAGTNRIAYILPVPADCNKITVKANSISNASVALLASNDHTQQTFPVYATGCSRISVSAGETVELLVPNDCTYLYVLKENNDISYLPEVLKGQFFVDLKAVNNELGIVTKRAFTKSGSSNATAFVQHDIVSGKSIMVYWETDASSANSMNLFSKDTSGGEVVETIATNLHPDTVMSKTISLDAKGLFLSATASGTIYIIDSDTVHWDLETLKQDISGLQNETGDTGTGTFIKSGNNNATKTIPYQIKNGDTILIKWESENGVGNMDVYSRETPTGTSVQTLYRGANPGVWYSVVATADAEYVFVSATRSGSIIIKRLGTLNGDIQDHENRITKLESFRAVIPLVNFSFPKTMLDVSSMVAEIGLTQENIRTMADVVYAKFHQLSVDYPEYVTEVFDAEDEIDSELGITLTKPWYMSNVAAGTEHTIDTDTEGGTYTYTVANASEAYTVRMYKLIQDVPALGRTGKRKLFLTAGVHGNEVVAPVDVYMLAKKLCEPNADEDLIKLRSAYDIYILPFVNVFGGRNLTRVNGNLTDTTRNYPTIGWTHTTVTENTFSNLATCVFSGKSAGSEYETQLHMALIDSIKPDVYIDHHNSGTGVFQFYSVVADDRLAPMIYQAALDCTVAFTENLPEYFGTDYFTILGTGGSPYTLSPKSGSCTYWTRYNRDIVCTGTVEVFEAINFYGGENTSDRVKYSNDTFKVNFFTLKNTLLHFCQCDMQYEKKKS